VALLGLDVKILSWNVNGLRSALNKGLKEIVASRLYDAVLLQEVKVDFLPLELNDLGYHTYLNPARKKGYSGVLSMVKQNPIAVQTGLGDPRFDSEGRILTLELSSVFLVNAYFLNSQHGLVRLGQKLEFNEALLRFVEDLRHRKPIVICGDFNVAHQEIDIARPKENVKNPGFTTEERNWMTEFLRMGYIDTYRMFVKEGGHYSWWSYRFDARKKNIGWRIDYCVVSKEIQGRVLGSAILEDVYGSDHAPVTLDLDL
jgi:exodeoxyribonuclease-3